MKINRALLYFCFLFSTFCFALSGFAQSTAFTYQGRLEESSGPANGSYDFQFQLFDALSGGSSLGGSTTNSAVNISSGLFTVTLDFGNQFPGANRWLEIAARTNGAGAFGVLSPRQPLTATPYAIRAANATSAVSISGTVSASQLTGTISSNNIAAGSISTVKLAAGAVGANQLAGGAVTTSALIDGAVTALKLATVTSGPLATTFTNPTPAVGDHFGYSVAAVGDDRVLIGATLDNTGATDAGAAYLFSIKGTLLATFTNPAPASFDTFGSSVAAVGSDRVLIGATGYHTGEGFVGAAYLFSTNGTWITTFTNPTPANFDNFGNSVAAVGSDRVIIGADEDDTGATNAGAAYLFSTNGNLLTTFTHPTPATNDFFGWSVAAVGSDRVLIGAPGDDTGAFDAGAAYLFSTNGTLIKTFTNSTPAAGDSFGYSVAAVGGDRVLIGAYQDSTGAKSAGAAYLLSINGSLLATFTNPAPAFGDNFGSSVEVVGSDRVMIGAFHDDTGGTDAGAAYLFSTNGNLLTTFTPPSLAAGDNFGASVAAVGRDRVLIGAYRDDTGATNAGAAYLFAVESYNPGLVAEGVRSGVITTDSLVDGAVTAAKISGVLLASQIPDLDAARITSGILNTNRIPNLDASKIASGTLADARLSTTVAFLNSAQVFTADKTLGAGAQLFADSGSATAPGLSFNADGDTGLFRPVLNTIAFATAGSEAMRITSVGNVGIGTINPTRELEVQNAGDVEIGIKSTDANAHLWTLQSSTLTGDVNRDASFQIIDRTVGTARLLIGTNGFVGIGTASPTNRLHVGGGVSATAFVTTSDRNAKENFTPVSPREVLQKVTALPISTWNFKEMKDGRHMGPMAQDFYAAFGLGGGNTTITTIDPDGVALAAIQGLNQKVEAGSQKSALRIEKLEAENAELKQRLEKLERILSRNANGGRSSK